MAGPSTRKEALGKFKFYIDISNQAAYSSMGTTWENKGIFGLSKALTQANFANIYVGERCTIPNRISAHWGVSFTNSALKHPFHEVKTHSEFVIAAYHRSLEDTPQARTSVIKSMWNVNVKVHPATVTAKECKILVREQTLLQNEQRLTSLLNQKDQETMSLQQLVSQLQQQQQQFSLLVEAKELRLLMMKREEEVAITIAKREEEIMEAVRNRETEVDAACVQRKELIKEVDEWIRQQVLDMNELMVGARYLAYLN
ncbi:hypothetical protein M413DRAFT_9528 [Hebeloma cylindrosporum]|uniref:Uncharacterized protein n=1 Tax=Hebeloma cylindrosporum TaxID=76867 RepID=A0A0C3CH43_HEBCY|nr:hypothetical protein M413DRAFT_9528 [Hebeloma cylindrosporum h7]